jgi:hypothetical protein
MTIWATVPSKNAPILFENRNDNNLKTSVIPFVGAQLKGCHTFMLKGKRPKDLVVGLCLDRKKLFNDFPTFPNRSMAARRRLQNLYRCSLTNSSF